MATIRFGAECDRCHVRHVNYSREDVVNCEDCGLDLCDKCSDATGHRLVREDDLDQSALRGCSPRCKWECSFWRCGREAGHAGPCQPAPRPEKKVLDTPVRADVPSRQ